MPEPTNDATHLLGPDDDVLAARLRDALDTRVAPVRLDEVITLIARGNGGDSPSTTGGASATALAGAEVADVDGPRFVAGVGPRSPRRRWPMALAAAAAVVLLVGVASVVLRSTSDDVTVDVGPADAGAPPAPGGIFDPDATVLHDKRVWGMAADAVGRIYLTYSVWTSDPTDPGGGIGEGEEATTTELLSQAEELENQAAAVGAEVAALDAEIASDPDSPASEVRRSEAAGLRDRQSELLLEAVELRAQVRVADDVGRVHGLLVADARDGSVLADHELPGIVFGGSIDSLDTNVWFVAEGEGGVSQLWTVTGTDTPRVVADLPGAMDLAVGADGLWLRGVGELQRRDPLDGALHESSGSSTWSSRGSLAVGSSGTWAAGTGSVVRVDGVEAASSLGVAGTPDDPSMVLVAGGSVLGIGGDRVTRHDVATSSATQGYALSSMITGADARGDRAWVVADAVDPAANLVEVLEIDGTTGRHRPAMVPMIGEVPSVVALEGGDAVICTAVPSSATDQSEPTPQRSSCRRVASPLDDPNPVAPNSDDPSAADEPSAPPASDSATTVPPTIPLPSSTTSTPPAPVLDPMGISVEGLDPIRLGMTADEVRAATGLEVRSSEPCDADSFEVVGLPEGVVVTFRGDETVATISIATDAFATADGLHVGSTVEQLTAVHPDLQVNDPVAPTTYILVADGRSTGMFFSTRDGVVTEISVLTAGDTFEDVCAATGAP